MERGKIIALEGLDGCGKGVQKKKLYQMMDAMENQQDSIFYQGRRVVFTREPGGTPFAEQMRSAIFQGKDLSGRTNLFNFFAARSDHWERVIVPTVNEGGIVITDRSDASTFAFQVYGQRDSQDMRNFFYEARRFVYGEYVPDLYLFIDVSPEECQRRLAKATLEGGHEITHFDTRALDFHRAVRMGYMVFGSDERHFVTVNGEQAIELVHRDIRQAINLIL